MQMLVSRRALEEGLTRNFGPSVVIVGQSAIIGIDCVVASGQNEFLVVIGCVIRGSHDYSSDLCLDGRLKDVERHQHVAVLGGKHHLRIHRAIGEVGATSRVQGNLCLEVQIWWRLSESAVHNSISARKQAAQRAPVRCKQVDHVDTRNCLDLGGFFACG